MLTLKYMLAWGFHGAQADAVKKALTDNGGSEDAALDALLSGA
jgi:hypothetical protein